MKEIRILIVDDHQIILDGLTSLLSSEGDFRVVGTAINGKEALETLNILTVDVVLMDIDMPIMNGLDAAGKIKRKPDAPKIIILSMHKDSGMVKNLIEMGVDGYLIKNSGKEEMVNAIRQVAQGKKVFSSDVTMSLIGNQEGSGKSKAGIDLTEREIEILRLIVDGFSNKEIGEQLYISHRTVDTHRTNMMKKLGVNNIAGLVSFAIKNKIVQ